MVWLSTNNMRGEPLFAKINRLARLVKCWEDLGKCRSKANTLPFFTSIMRLLLLSTISSRFECPLMRITFTVWPLFAVSLTASKNS